MTLKNYSSKIKVIGVGCGGNNIVNNLADCEMKNLSIVACDLDSKVLERSNASILLKLGKDGYGSGNNLEVAQREALMNEEICSLFDKGTCLAFIVATLGGGCGSGVAPIIARKSKELGVAAIGIATMPFVFEGERKLKRAFESLNAFSTEVDALFLLNNQSIVRHCGELPINEAFRTADKVICDIINLFSQYSVNQINNKIECRKKNTIFNKLKKIFSNKIR